jgi:hypothetical protein
MLKDAALGKPDRPKQRQSTASQQQQQRSTNITDSSSVTAKDSNLKESLTNESIIPDVPGVTTVRRRVALPFEVKEEAVVNSNGERIVAFKSIISLKQGKLSPTTPSPQVMFTLIQRLRAVKYVNNCVLGESTIYH